MTEDQAKRVAHLEATSLQRIPDGSWLAVRRDEMGGTWIEVLEPRPTGSMAFDFLRVKEARS